MVTSLPVAIKHRPHSLRPRGTGRREQVDMVPDHRPSAGRYRYYLHWVVWGTLAVIVIRSSRSYAYNRDMNLFNVHSNSRAMQSCMAQERVLRGY